MAYVCLCNLVLLGQAPGIMLEPRGLPARTLSSCTSQDMLGHGVPTEALASCQNKDVHCRQLL